MQESVVFPDLIVRVFLSAGYVREYLPGTAEHVARLAGAKRAFFFSTGFVST